MSRRYRSNLVLLAVALVGCSDKPTEGVDTIFFNAQIYTVDTRQEWAEAIAVDGDSIVFVGDSAGALALAGDNTERFDVGGKL
ncbi:MAG: hypothetical protein ACR2QS_04705, partial [Woeseiaceae bacterium]